MVPYGTCHRWMLSEMESAAASFAFAEATATSDAVGRGRIGAVGSGVSGAHPGAKSASSRTAAAGTERNIRHLGAGRAQLVRRRDHDRSTTLRSAAGVVKARHDAISMVGDTRGETEGPTWHRHGSGWVAMANRRLIAVNVRWGVAAVVALVVFVVANRHLVTGRAVGIWDVDGQYFPRFVLVADHARAGHFLRWDPWTDGGLPSFSEPQVGAFSPIVVAFGLVFGGNQA